jgi:hypothetical protein
VSSPERKWWSQFASIPVLLVVLGLFGLWFYDYQKSERAFLRARNLRLVDAVAVHVEKSVSSIQGSLHRMAQSAADGSLKGVDPDGASPVARLRALFRHLSFVKSIEAGPCRASAENRKDTPPGSAPPVRTKILSDRTPPLVQFDQPVSVPPGPGHAEEASAKTEEISVKVDVSEILRLETANDADGQPVFSDIVVATADGRVVSQRDTTGGRWVRLPPDLIRTADKGFQREIDGSISDEPVTVFRQFVQLPGSDPLILCGLVPTARLRAAARSFPSSIQLLLLLAVVLAGLAWPFLRIVFSGPADPLRPRHAAIAGIAAIAVVAILTLVAVDVALLRLGLADATNAELKGLACDVKTRFLNELGKAREALDHLPSDALTPDRCSHDRMFSDPRFQALRQTYPFVDEVDLVGLAPAPCSPTAASGEETECQLSKWSRHRYATPLYDVGTRHYVRDLREGLTWAVPGGPLVADHVRGFASGRKLTVVATFAGAALKPDANLETVPLQAISAEMISVSAPILPVGYEFAIFRENGDVVYHSVAQNSIDQNIYQEVGDARPFRSMAVTVPFATQYEGRDYLAYLTPIDGTPLRLAVLHDQVVPRTFNLRFISRTVVAGGLLFLLECFLLVATWIRSPMCVAWSWPNPARFGRLLLAFLFVASCAGAVAIVRWVIPGETLPMSLAGIVMGVVSCWYILDGIPKSALESSIARFTAVPLPFVGRASRWFARRVNNDATPETTKFTYVGLLTALLVLLAVLPTLALSDLTYRWSLRQELGGEALHLQDSWAARERTLAADYQHSNPDIADRRRDDLDDLYPSLDFNTKIGKQSCAGAPAGYPLGTATLLSIGDRIAMWLTPGGGASTAPTDDLNGSYSAAALCTKALTALSVADSASNRQRFITGNIRPLPPLGGWRPLGAAIPLLFGICWCAVVLFRRRVDGFLDAPLATPEARDTIRTPAEIWGACSDEEREVLAIVARRQLIPRCYEEAAASLARAGLIKFAPLPRQELPLLERYTRSAPLPAQRPSHAGFHGLAWRPVFSVLLLASAVFIYFTQGSGSLAFITALAGIIPHLDRIAALANLTPASTRDTEATPP